MNSCKYSFNKESAILIVPCDCSLMGGNNGRCQIANQKTYQMLSDKMTSLYQKMNFCHTSDRDNLVAYADCAPANGTADSDWSEAVRAKLDIEIYPQRLGDYQYTCLDKLHPHSLTNYLKTYYSTPEMASILRSFGVPVQKVFWPISASLIILNIF